MEDAPNELHRLWADAEHGATPRRLTDQILTWRTESCRKAEGLVRTQIGASSRKGVGSAAALRLHTGVGRQAPLTAQAGGCA